MVSSAKTKRNTPSQFSVGWKDTWWNLNSALTDNPIHVSLASHDSCIIACLFNFTVDSRSPGQSIIIEFLNECKNPIRYNINASSNSNPFDCDFPQSIKYITYAMYRWNMNERKMSIKCSNALKITLWKRDATEWQRIASWTHDKCAVKQNLALAVSNVWNWKNKNTHLWFMLNVYASKIKTNNQPRRRKKMFEN